jgi:blocked early in transport 1
MHQRKSGSVTTTLTNNSNMRNSATNRHGYHHDIEGGGGAGRGGNHNNKFSNDANSNILEQQNNERLNELSMHVAKLKGLTIDIGNEVREQNSLLDSMNDNFSNTRDMLLGSLSRIGTMLQNGGMKHMCIMIGFCVLVMLFLWWVMSHKG